MLHFGRYKLLFLIVYTAQKLISLKHLVADKTCENDLICLRVITMMIIMIGRAFRSFGIRWVPVIAWKHTMTGNVRRVD